MGSGEVNERKKCIKVPNSPATDFSSERSQKIIVHLGVKIDWNPSKITYTKHQLLQIIIRSYTHKSQENIFYYLLILLIHRAEPILVSTSSCLQAGRLQSLRKGCN